MFAAAAVVLGAAGAVVVAVGTAAAVAAGVAVVAHDLDRLRAARGAVGAHLAPA
jgi:hypothetical protein